MARPKRPCFSVLRSNFYCKVNSPLSFSTFFLLATPSPLLPPLYFPLSSLLPLCSTSLSLSLSLSLMLPSPYPFPQIVCEDMFDQTKGIARKDSVEG